MYFGTYVADWGVMMLKVVLVDTAGAGSQYINTAASAAAVIEPPAEQESRELYLCGSCNVGFQVSVSINHIKSTGTEW